MGTSPSDTPPPGTGLAARIHRHERGAAAVSFVYFFCVLAAYYVMRPVRDQLSAAVGSRELPWFFAATFVATLLLTPVFAWLVSHWPRKVVVPAVYLFFIVCLLGFIPFFTNEGLVNPRALGTVFFVWVSVFNLFVVSVFWSFMTDIWSEEQSRRLFPIIALGGTAGAISGPALTSLLVNVIGVAPLLVVSVLLLGASLLCVFRLNAWASTRDAGATVRGEQGGTGGSMFDGLKQIFVTPFIRNMAILMLLGDAIGTIAYAHVIDYSRSAFDTAVQRTAFQANLDLWTNILQVTVQLTLTRWLLARYGAGPVIVLWAVFGGLACMAMALSDNPYAPVLGSLPWVAVMLMVTRGLSYGMVLPARESLYTYVPRELRYKGKNAVDTAVWRAGDVMSASAMNGLRSLGAGTATFGWIGAAALGMSGLVGWRLARRVERREPSAISVAPRE